MAKALYYSLSSLLFSVRRVGFRGLLGRREAATRGCSKGERRAALSTWPGVPVEKKKSSVVY